MVGGNVYCYVFWEEKSPAGGCQAEGAESQRPVCLPFLSEGAPVWLEFCEQQRVDEQVARAAGLRRHNKASACKWLGAPGGI